MPTEHEELVQFLHHANPQIRQIALENLVGYSQGHADLFLQSKDGVAIDDLKRLAGDRVATTAHDALTILINLSAKDKQMRDKKLAEDDVFLERLLARMTQSHEPHADLAVMLLANLSKCERVTRLLAWSRSGPVLTGVCTSRNAMDQLMDCFVKGVGGGYNPSANFDHLAYVFADLAISAQGRRYFTGRRAYDGVIPLSKLIVFTEHASEIRRRGVAWTMKNVAFDVPSHALLLDPAQVDLLPFLLLPLVSGADEYPDEETFSMPAALQLLDAGKQREPDRAILTTHLETLLLLTTTRHGRDVLRAHAVYPLLRQMHLALGDGPADEAAQEVCERVVAVLMRDEPDLDPDDDDGGGKAVVDHDKEEEDVDVDEDDDEDEDEDRIVEIA
ncbi:MAG: hypothetical protein M1826_004778 [Phylliscum demangeonii]|nr:MAG: hypothetical protein M1826_004778 [Phylliscum demangeonii]